MKINNLKLICRYKYFIGLRPSNDKESVMSRYYTSNISTLKANDIREIQRIYGVPPNK